MLKTPTLSYEEGEKNNIFDKNQFKASLRRDYLRYTDISANESSCLLSIKRIYIPYFRRDAFRIDFFLCGIMHSWIFRGCRKFLTRSGRTSKESVAKIKVHVECRAIETCGKFSKVTLYSNSSVLFFFYAKSFLNINATLQEIISSPFIPLFV